MLLFQSDDSHSMHLKHMQIVISNIQCSVQGFESGEGVGGVIVHFLKQIGQM